MKKLFVGILFAASLSAFGGTYYSTCEGLGKFSSGGDVDYRKVKLGFVGDEDNSKVTVIVNDNTGNDGEIVEGEMVNDETVVIRDADDDLTTTISVVEVTDEDGLTINNVSVKSVDSAGNIESEFSGLLECEYEAETGLIEVLTSGNQSNSGSSNDCGAGVNTSELEVEVPSLETQPVVSSTASEL